ncbi:FecR domain-containing protein [Acinetobacter baumannii]|uniref:FecR family protein n=1 Tax=Acinetobacter baumannii TaxID=470 RepID=UPI0029401C15|nr:FecR domain-containing protein [Acinetobacter baumannii]MDV4276675.1 FecR domain-containing protein [Acinetobacter baumannii]
MRSDRKLLKEQAKQYQLKDIQQMIACFEDNILPHISSKEEILQRAKQRRFNKTKAMSSVLAIFGMGVGLYWYNPILQKQHYTTSIGEQKQVLLIDGSQVSLNTNTKIDILQRLRSRELVLNQGEAIFTVAHGQNPVSRLFERSFTVTAGQVYIRDIGTIFNVHKLSDEDVIVTVLEGKVDVSGLKQKKPAIPLVQGQQVRYQPLGFSSVQQIETYRASAWQSGKIVFEQTRLEDALKEFQRYSKFDVMISNEQLKSIPVSGQFSVNNYEQFMQVLPQVAPVQVITHDHKQWRIEKK